MTTTGRIKELVDCRELAAQYLGQPAQRAGRAWQWYCPWHEDRATPSLTVYRNGYCCFGCGAQGDHLALIMALEQVDFAAARERLGWGAAGLEAAGKRRAGCEPGRQVRGWHAAGWQWAAWQAIDEAARRLEGAAGAAGRAYLSGRGIAPETWRAWRLGYAVAVKRWERCGERWQGVELGPGITLPWVGGQVVKALQYRLIGHATLRYWQKAGGERTLFGVDLVRGRSVLVLCEGELNALSVWQAAREWVDVVSFGPQGNVEQAGPLLRRLAGRYARVVVWADERRAALAGARLVAGGTRALAFSPEEGESRVIALCSPGGMDANDLLLAGVLREFVAEVVGRWE